MRWRSPAYFADGLRRWLFHACDEDLADLARTTRCIASAQMMLRPGRHLQEFQHASPPDHEPLQISWQHGFDIDVLAASRPGWRRAHGRAGDPHGIDTLVVRIYVSPTACGSSRHSPTTQPPLQLLIDVADVGTSTSCVPPGVCVIWPMPPVPMTGRSLPTIDGRAAATYPGFQVAPACSQKNPCRWWFWLASRKGGAVLGPSLRSIQPGKEKEGIARWSIHIRSTVGA